MRSVEYFGRDGRAKPNPVPKESPHGQHIPEHGQRIRGQQAYQKNVKKSVSETLSGGWASFSYIKRTAKAIMLELCSSTVGLGAQNYLLQPAFFWQTLSLGSIYCGPGT